MIYALGMQERSDKPQVYHYVLPRWLSDKVFNNTSIEEFNNYNEKTRLINNDIKVHELPSHKIDKDR